MVMSPAKGPLGELLWEAHCPPVCVYMCVYVCMGVIVVTLRFGSAALFRFNSGSVRKIQLNFSFTFRKLSWSACTNIFTLFSPLIHTGVWFSIYHTCIYNNMSEMMLYCMHI